MTHYFRVWTHKTSTLIKGKINKEIISHCWMRLVSTFRLLFTLAFLLPKEHAFTYWIIKLFSTWTMFRRKIYSEINEKLSLQRFMGLSWVHRNVLFLCFLTRDCRVEPLIFLYHEYLVNYIRQFFSYLFGFTVFCEILESKFSFYFQRTCLEENPSLLSLVLRQGICSKLWVFKSCIMYIANWILGLFLNFRFFCRICEINEKFSFWLFMFLSRVNWNFEFFCFCPA